MKEIKKTLEFVKKNKLRFLSCLALDILFVIIFVALLIQQMPAIQENVIVFNKLLDDSGATNMGGSLTKLSTHSEEINILGGEIRKEVGRLTISILIFANIIYALFFSIMLKKLKSWYPAIFLGLNVMIQGVLWLTFKIIVDVKGSVSEAVVLPEKSMSSVVLFILICYVIYFIGLVIFIELRNKKAIKNSLNIFKSKVLKLFFLYLVIGFLFWVTLALLQLPFILNMKAVGILIMLILTITIFFGYFTLSKIFLMESVIVAENKKEKKNSKK